MDNSTPHSSRQDEPSRTQAPRPHRARAAARAFAIIGTIAAAAFSVDTVYSHLAQAATSSAPKAAGYAYVYPFDISMMVAMMAR